MIWHGLGGCTSEMFVDHKQMPVEFFNKDQLVKIGEKDFTSLDKWFILKFASGNEVTARINEEFMCLINYVHEW